MKQKTMNGVYIALVTVLAISLLLGFLCDMHWLDLGNYAWMGHWVTSPVALVIGLVFALSGGKAYPDFNKQVSKKLLQYSIIGLGLGMNLYAAVADGREGMLFTIISMFGTLGIGWLIGRRLLKVDAETSYLISSGTAICGGSAIAAVGPIIKAKSESMSVALGVVFILNAVALFIFPAIGSALGMTMKQFGMWAAIAIHDTSSVVGAGSAYDAMHPALVAAQGVSALEVATTIKLTRALWIVVLALVTPFFFLHSLAGEGGKPAPWYKAVPTFIIWFIVAVLFNTFVLSNAALLGDAGAAVGMQIGGAVARLGKYMITLSLFFIGASLTRETLKAVGLKSMIQGILLWITISCVSWAYIMWV